MTDRDGLGEHQPAYYGRCDSCAGEIRGSVGKVLMRRAGPGEVQFRFCSGECRQAFIVRDDVTEVPDVE